MSNLVKIPYYRFVEEANICLMRCSLKRGIYKRARNKRASKKELVPQKS